MYPETITVDGVEYSVNVDSDSAGEICYFQLQYPSGEIFFECDWQGDFTQEDVLGLL